MKYTKYPFNFPTDAAAVQATLDTVLPLVADFKDVRRSSTFDKFQIKLSYVLDRIDHMEAQTEEEDQKRAEQLDFTLSLIQKLEDQAEAASKSEVGAEVQSASSKAFVDGAHEVPRSSGRNTPFPTT